MLRTIGLSLLLFFLFSSCSFRHAVTLRSIDNLSLDIEEDFSPVLTVQASLHNASAYDLELSGLQLAIFINDKKIATVSEHLKVTIASRSDFTVPLTIRPSFEEAGPVGALFDLLGDTQHTIRCEGRVTLRFWGFSFRIPVSYTRD